MKVPTISRYDNIGIFDLFDDGEELWFTSIEYNALFKMNKQTTKMEYVGSFPNEYWGVYRLYTSINEYEGMLFFTPCAAYEIGIYDKNNKQFKKVNIGLSKQDNDISKIKYGKKFISGFIYNDTLILIPCCYDKTVFYDILNDKLHMRDELFRHFYAEYKSFITSSDSQFYLCWYAKRINETEIIFDLHCNQNVAVIYNLATGEFKERKIGNPDRSFSLIECSGNHIYLYDEMADILVRWERYTDEVMEYSIAEMLPRFQACGLNHSFVNMVALEDRLYLIPANTNIAVRINIAAMDAFADDALCEECSILNNEVAYLGLSRVFNNKLYLFANRSKNMIVYGENKIMQIIKTEISPKDYYCIQKEHIRNLLDHQEYLFSENEFSLNIFLDEIMDFQSEEYEQEMINTNQAGRTIYDYIKNY